MIRTVNSPFFTSTFQSFGSALLLMLMSFSIVQASCNKEVPIKPGGADTIRVKIGTIQDLPDHQHKANASLTKSRSVVEMDNKKAPDKKS